MTDGDGEMVLDLGQQQTDMWLLKVPHGELADALSKAVDNEVLGKVVLKVPVAPPAESRQRKRKAERVVKLAVDPTMAKRHAVSKGAADASAGGLHPLYTMGKKPVKAGSMLVFAEQDGSADGTDGDGAVAVVGKINNHFVLQVDSLQSIEDRFSKRVVNEADKETTSQVSGPMMHHYNPRGQVHLDQRRQQAAKGTTQKATAIGVTPDQIKVRLFKRFEAFTYYSLSDLAKLEKLPQAAVRAVLDEIATKENEGEHRHKWALKPAYRT